jgi:predicted O-methyltransferase YrrM
MITKTNEKAIGFEIPPSFSEHDRVVLHLLLERVSRPGMKVLEIGSYVGNGSTREILTIAKKNKGTVYCVDTWKGSDNVQRHLDFAEKYNLFATFCHHVGLPQNSSWLKPVIMESRAAATVIKDSDFDLIFIDGNHSYASVFEDIKLWKSKVRPGGILCGHDCEGSLLDFQMDLRKMVQENPSMDSIPMESFRFQVCHPGTILAVHDHFGERIKIWGREALETTDGIVGRSSIWSTS